MPRPALLTVEKKACTKTFAAYPKEHEAMRRLKSDLGVHGSFDVVRDLIHKSPDPLVAKRRREFRKPRRASVSEPEPRE